MPARQRDRGGSEDEVMHEQATTRGLRQRNGAGSSMESVSGASDARLVEETKRGNQEAFGELVRRYERRLIRVITRFVPGPELAEDLAQETFLRVFQRLEQFDPARRFAPWLFRIGVNLALDHHRRKRRRVWGVLFTDRAQDKWIDLPTSDPRPELDLQQEVRRVIDRIPDVYRTVLVLRDLENFSTSEIAAILDRREATVRWRLAEARNRFQQLWRQRQT